MAIVNVTERWRGNGNPNGSGVLLALLVVLFFAEKDHVRSTWYASVSDGDPSVGRKGGRVRRSTSVDGGGNGQ